MATPSEKLAESLEALHTLENANGTAAIRTRDLSRTHRERLVASGFLREVIKGWYIPARPDEPQGESTAWYASFWAFVAAYLESRFRKNWSLSPEQSLSLHAGNWTVPQQLVVRAPRAGNKVMPLPPTTPPTCAWPRRLRAAGAAARRWPQHDRGPARGRFPQQRPGRHRRRPREDDDRRRLQHTRERPVR
jgi:hypothetical protein